VYFDDVEMQACCAHYAKLYNAHQPPRRIKFAHSYLIKLLEREGTPLCGVEEHIRGEYVKHTNNIGDVSSVQTEMQVGRRFGCAVQGAVRRVSSYSVQTDRPKPNLQVSLLGGLGLCGPRVCALRVVQYVVCLCRG
jgi:hypothetical protein